MYLKWITNLSVLITRYTQICTPSSSFCPVLYLRKLLNSPVSTLYRIRIINASTWRTGQKLLCARILTYLAYYKSSKEEREGGGQINYSFRRNTRVEHGENEKSEARRGFHCGRLANFRRPGRAPKRRKKTAIKLRERWVGGGGGGEYPRRKIPARPFLGIFNYVKLPWVINNAGLIFTLPGVSLPRYSLS